MILPIDSITADSVVGRGVAFADSGWMVDSATMIGGNMQTFCEEIPKQQGVAGEAIPYTIISDNLFLVLLIVCLMAVLVVVSVLYANLLERTAYLFRASNNTRQHSVIVPSERRGLWFLAIITCLMYSFLYLFYFHDSTNNTYISYRYLFFLLFFATFVVFFFLRGLIVMAVNKVFFDNTRCQQYADESLLLCACEGLLLLPIVYIVTFFGVSLRYAVVYVAVVFLACRLLSLYRQKEIFFKTKDMLLAYFVYLCTLEIAPFIALWGVLSLVSGIAETQL